MESDDLTIEILKSIRDEIRGLRETTDKRFGETNTRLESLERRQTETEVRLATELVAVVGAVNQVKELLASRFDLSEKVEDHEKRLTILENRTGS